MAYGAVHHAASRCALPGQEDDSDTYRAPVHEVGLHDAVARCSDQGDPDDRLARLPPVVAPLHIADASAVAMVARSSAVAAPHQGGVAQTDAEPSLDAAQHGARSHHVALGTQEEDNRGEGPDACVAAGCEAEEQPGVEQQLDDAAGPDTWLVHPQLVASLGELLVVGSNVGARLVEHHALAPGLGIPVEPQAVGLAVAAHIQVAHQGALAGGRQDGREGGHCGGYPDGRQEVEHERSLAVEVQQDRMQALGHLSNVLLQVVPGACLGLALVPGREEHCVAEGVALEPHAEQYRTVEHCVERPALVEHCGVLEHPAYVATRYEQVVLPEQQYCVECPAWVARRGVLEHPARVAARSEQVAHLEQDH